MSVGFLTPTPHQASRSFDHHIYVIASDGDLEEGVSHEASAIAGVQELGNLIVIWDDNKISIEHETDIAFGEDVLKRYEAYGWHTQRVDWVTPEGYEENPDALLEAIEAAKAETGKPSIHRPEHHHRLAVTHQAEHRWRARLGAWRRRGRGLKKVLGFDPEQSFVVEPRSTSTPSRPRERGQAAHSAWNAEFAKWQSEQPERAALLDRLLAKELPANWADSLPTFEAGTQSPLAAASGKVLDRARARASGAVGRLRRPRRFQQHHDGWRAVVPASAPLHEVVRNASWYGRTLHFGIREFGMGTILNGITLHGLTRAYGGTFLVFSDYMRGSVRLAALMGIPTTFVWTHDSIGLGEDGPTHQPIEHVATLRAIPGIDIVRPADANETAWAWKHALETTDRPAGLILTRQNVPTLEGTSAEGFAKGAYVLAGADEDADVILIGTGSEVQPACAARELLAADGIKARVVSMPCKELFERQDVDYRESVLPPPVKARVSVEAGSPLGWSKCVGDAGRIDRHRPLRRVRFGQPAHEEVRLHAGERGRQGQGKRRVCTLRTPCWKRAPREARFRLGSHLRMPDNSSRVGITAEGSRSTECESSPPTDIHHHVGALGTVSLPGASRRGWQVSFGG